MEDYLFPFSLPKKKSAIWPVSEAAMNASASTRVETLSRPKALHQDYEPCRQVQTLVSEAAMKAEPSQRTEVLANAKTYAPLKIKPNTANGIGANGNPT